MGNIFIFFFSVACLCAGLTFLYKPEWVVRFNRFFREKVFNDHLSYSNRHLRAAFLLILSFSSAFWCYHRVQYADSRITRSFISTDRLLYQSLQHFYARQYEASRALSQKVLAREPDNAEALYQMAAAQFMLDDMAAGEEYWKKAKQMEPASVQAERLKHMILQVKNSTSSVLQ